MMNAISNPQAAAKQARKDYRDVTTPDTSAPEAVRAMAEKTVDQSRGPTPMERFDYSAEAELFPLRSRGFNRGPVGYRRFTTAAKAIRFAIEELQPELLRGASLEVEEARFDAHGIRQLYESEAYPLKRRPPVRA